MLRFNLKFKSESAAGLAGSVPEKAAVSGYPPAPAAPVPNVSVLPLIMAGC
jgi:hypothetical protein